MTYEYVCSSCGHQWEASQSIKDAALKSCPKCKKKTAKRQVSGGTGFVLKGGGWYADLYGSAPAGGRSKTESDKSEASASSDSDAGAAASSGEKAAPKVDDKAAGGKTAATAKNPANDSKTSSPKTPAAKKPSGTKGNS